MSTTAAYLGARYGPDIIRRAVDSGRTWRSALLIAIAIPFVLLFTAGWAFAVSEVVPLLVLVLGFAAAASWTLLCDALGRWIVAPRVKLGPILTVSPSQIRAVAWQRSPLALVRPFVSIVSMLAAAGSLLWLWLARDISIWWWIAVVLIAALPVSYIWQARRGISTGGLYLTPEGIEHVWGPAYSVVPWDGVELGRKLNLAKASIRRVRVGEYWGADPTDRETRGFDASRLWIPIPPAYLPQRADELHRIIAFYVQYPTARPSLGTDTPHHLSAVLDIEPRKP